MTTYTTPSTQVTSTLITADIYNQQIINNILHLATVHKAQVRNSSNISITTSGTWQALTFDTEDQDSDDYHSTSSNTSRITIPTGLAGNYDIKGVVRWEANATGRRELRILLNGTTVLWQITEPTTTATAFFQQIAAEYELDEGDYIELEALQISGGALNVEAASPRSPVFVARWTGFVA